MRIRVASRFDRVSPQEIRDQGLVFCGKRLAGELFQRGPAARREIEPELVGEIESIPPRMAVTTRELLDQSLDTGCGFC